MIASPVLLVVGKAPVAGLAKTRLARDVGAHAAADLAAASMLDTLDTARASGWPVLVALTGDLAAAARRDAVREALAGCVVVSQRGTTFGARLASAHADAARTFASAPGVVQIGTDTPQVGIGDLAAAHRLLMSCGSVVGPATDGGWWVLGLTDATDATCLMDVPMSRGDTCASTVKALRARGLSPGITATLDDVDCAADAERVALDHPELRFAAAWRAALAASS